MYNIRQKDKRQNSTERQHPKSSPKTTSVIARKKGRKGKEKREGTNVENHS